jgi:hypothetical protein
VADVTLEQELVQLKARVSELEARLERIGCTARPPASFGAPKHVTCTLPFGHEGMHQQCRKSVFGGPGEDERIAW